MKESIKKFLAIVAIAIAISIILIADGKAGESACGGEGKYNQTTGKCVSK